MHNSRLVIHPAWLRTTHWLNAIAVVILMMSGWKIYNATAFLGFAIPKEITLGTL
jgi:thiosulfate reductase cytochrome b subunit